MNRLFVLFFMVIFYNSYSVNYNSVKQNNTLIPFIENKGQFSKGILFGINTFAGNVYITEKKEIIYSLFNKKKSKLINYKEFFLKSNKTAILGENSTSTKVNYFKGANPSQWKTNISSYEIVNLGEIYKGIQLKLKAVNKNIEKLFFVQPFSNVNDIEIVSDIAINFSINNSGELIVNTQNGILSFTKPNAYQCFPDGKKVKTEISYVIKEKGYGFKVGNYDKSKELVIDPLIASTFVGSSTYDDDYGPSLQIDNDGYVYLCGYTGAASFPYKQGYDSTFNGGSDIFIAKFSNDLSTLIASTFIGGSGNEYEATMSFDYQKQYLYVSGYTASKDFPCTDNAFDKTHNGGIDVYILKIDKNLSHLISSSYFGGSANEGQKWPKLDITVGKSGNVYITGLTCSVDIPLITNKSYDKTYSGGTVGGDAFIAKFNSNITELLGSTYIGGSKNEWRMSIAIDNNENVFVCGETESDDFEFTTNSFNSLFNGGSDIFICKYNSDLSELICATSFGKENYEEPLDIKINSDNHVYIAGYTKSSNFHVTTGTYSNTYSGGNRDGYIAKFSNDLKQLLASTYIGGSFRDDCTSLIIDKSGDVYIAGNTTSTNFPISSKSYCQKFSGGAEYGDAFICIFDKNLTKLKASTYIGGNHDDKALDISLYKDDIFIAGYSKSINFPSTKNAFDQDNNEPYGDCFIAKFSKKL